MYLCCFMCGINYSSIGKALWKVKNFLFSILWMLSWPLLSSRFMGWKCEGMSRRAGGWPGPRRLTTVMPFQGATRRQQVLQTTSRWHKYSHRCPRRCDPLRIQYQLFLLTSAIRSDHICASLIFNMGDHNPNVYFPLWCHLAHCRWWSSPISHPSAICPLCSLYNHLRAYTAIFDTWQLNGAIHSLPRSFADALQCQLYHA